MHGVFQKRQQGEAFSEKILMFYFFSHCSKIELIPEVSRLTTPVDTIQKPFPQINTILLDKGVIKVIKLFGL